MLELFNVLFIFTRLSAQTMLDYQIAFGLELEIITILASLRWNKFTFNKEMQMCPLGTRDGMLKLIPKYSLLKLPALMDEVFER